jgi:hypothetical protein
MSISPYPVPLGWADAANTLSNFQKNIAFGVLKNSGSQGICSSKVYYIPAAKVKSFQHFLRQQAWDISLCGV